MKTPFIEAIIERHAADWWTIREAAKLLLREARCLRESHTVCNHWDDDDHSARKAYKELVHSALNLRRIRL